jgi:hypothetical protein
LAVNVEEAFLKSAHIIYDKWKRGLIQLEMPNTVQIRRNDKSISSSKREAVRSPFLSLLNIQPLPLCLLSSFVDVLLSLNRNFYGQERTCSC